MVGLDVSRPQAVGDGATSKGCTRCHASQLRVCGIETTSFDGMSGLHWVMGRPYLQYVGRKQFMIGCPLWEPTIASTHGLSAEVSAMALISTTKPKKNESF